MLNLFQHPSRPNGLFVMEKWILKRVQDDDEGENGFICDSHAGQRELIFARSFY